MKKLLIFLLLPIVVHAAVPSSDLIASLKPFQPISTTIEDGNLIIVLNQKMITSDIYTSVISTAVCASLWLRNKESLAGVTSVTVLNEFSFKGYVFEGGKDLCMEFGEIPQDKNNIFLLGHTHLK